MSNNTKIQIGLITFLILLAGAVVYLGVQSFQPPKYAGLDDEIDEDKQPREPYSSPRTDGEIDPGSGDILAGGVERPGSDLAKRDPDESASKDEALGVGTIYDYGKTPPVAIDANEQVALVAEATRTGGYPERLTVAVGSKSAKQYDPGRFDSSSDRYDEAYRTKYLMSPEPGRVWHPAQPGPGVRRIEPLMPTFVKVDQGEEIELRVGGEPGHPVTFTSFDLGRFENQLTTITVVTDDQGVAEAIFVGPPGTADDVRIMAASPVTSGQVRLTVHVVGPNAPGFGEAR